MNPTTVDAAQYGFAFVIGASVAQGLVKAVRNWRSFMPKKYHAYYCHCDRCMYDERHNEKAES